MQSSILGAKLDIQKTRAAGEVSTEMQYVRDVLANVWAEVLVGTPMQDELTWSEAGVDSLRSLQLLLRLEEVLQRNLSFDMFARELTPSDLIRTLATSPAPLTDDQSVAHTLFVVPGIFGDEPSLANFRRGFAGSVSVFALILPELDQSVQVLGDLRATARFLIDQINAMKPTGPISIAGYSFGGFVAHQLAADLVEAGRDVQLLCLLDPFSVSAIDVRQDPVADTGWAQALWAKVRPHSDEGSFLYFQRILLRALVQIKQFDLARRIFNANGHDRRFERIHLRRVLLFALRTRAMRSWAPRPYLEPTLLISSEASSQRGFDKYWSTVCPNITVQPVSADHYTLFEPAPMAQLVPAVLRALGLNAPDKASKMPRLRPA